MKTAWKTERKLYIELGTICLSLSKHARCMREHFFSILYSCSAACAESIFLRRFVGLVLVSYAFKWGSLGNLQTILMS